MRVTRGNTRRRASRAVGIVAMLMGSLLMVAPEAPASTVTEVLRPDTAGNIGLEGRGFGHGIGMSQWGAYGAASRGLSTASILDFYYPGTASATLPDRLVRVLLSGLDPQATTVIARGTMTLTWNGQTISLPAINPATRVAVSRWRLVPNSAAAGLLLQVQDAGAPAFTTYARSVATEGSFASSANLVRAHLAVGTQREYRGTIRGFRTTTTMVTINDVMMEQYLRGVVPAEMPSSWSAQALAAQAVAARTYAAYERATRTTNASDICDSTSCQVYRGLADYTDTGGLIASTEAASTDAAVAGSKGQIRTYSGSVAFTQYSASNGGYSVAGSTPYTVARSDPYDGAIANSANRWTTTITATQVSQAWPVVGQLTTVTVTGRDGLGPWGGRVTGIRIVGTQGSVDVSGHAFARALGLRSTLFAGVAPLKRSVSMDVNSDGWADLVAQRRDTKAVQLFTGLASGAFAEPTTVSTALAMADMVIATGDTNGDGVSDLAVRTTDGFLWQYPLSPTGVMQPGRKIGYGWQSMVMVRGGGDLNQDGYPDIVAADRTGNLYSYAMGATGSIISQRQIGNGWGGMDVILPGVDLSGDGIPDIVSREAPTGRLVLYRGSSTGALTDGIVIGTGWQAFDLLTISATQTTVSILGRLPLSASGQLRRYPVRVGLVPTFGSPTTAGSGWNAIATTW